MVYNTDQSPLSPNDQSTSCYHTFPETIKKIKININYNIKAEIPAYYLDVLLLLKLKKALDLVLKNKTLKGKCKFMIIIVKLKS